MLTPSPAQAHNGQKLDFPKWMPRKGPNGGRVVVDFLHIVWHASDITVASAALDGRDIWRAISRVTLHQLGGRKRVDLRGDQLRIANYKLLGPRRVQEYPDVAIGANQDLSFVFTVPIAKPFMYNGTDLSLPSDLLELVEIETADEAELSVGSVDFTHTASRYYIVAEWHEEFSVILHAEDELKAFTSNNAESTNLPVFGRLHDLSLHKRGASGGADVSDLGTVLLDGIHQRPMQVDPDLSEAYRFSRELAATSAVDQGDELIADPHLAATPGAVPVVWGNGAKCYDGPLRQQIIIEYGDNDTGENLDAICHIMKPKSREVIDAVGNAYGGRGVEIAAKKGYQPGPDFPKEFRAFMPERVLGARFR